MSFDQPLPTSLSPSRLADFQACPRKYQHASVERIPQPASYASAKGRFVQKVVVSTTMGPGILVDPNRTRNVAVDVEGDA